MYYIDGRKLAGDREVLLIKKVGQFIKLNRRRPSLLAIELSDDPGSKLYLKLKTAAAARIGIEFKVVKRSDLACPAGRRAVRQGLTLINSEIHTDGIFIQHPPGYDKRKWQELADQIPPEKDVDCLTSENLNLIKREQPRFLPATVKAVGYCLRAAFESIVRSDLGVRQGPTLSDFLSGKKVVILGRSPILGLPLSWYLKNLGATVTLLHSQSAVNDSLLTINSADILISSVGRPKIITGDMVKKGVIAIDCGSPSGDVVFDEVAPKAGAITPVPGGVGPLTVVSLMENVFQAASQKS
jgi:methylenetetrahydrofolate dehydrogenase (NADP+)/methenyltetrahydrofolate cyclohydrolase